MTRGQGSLGSRSPEPVLLIPLVPLPSHSSSWPHLPNPTRDPDWRQLTPPEDASAEDAEGTCPLPGSGVARVCGPWHAGRKGSGARPKPD